MPTHVVRHPVAAQALTALRDRTTAPSRFRRLAHRATLVLVAEATRDLPVRPELVETPLERTTGEVIDADLVVVPILRAGLSMLEATLELLPHARVGHVGLQRDEETAVAATYFSKLPPRLEGSLVILVDPMLATGGSAIGAANLLKTAGARHIRLVCLVAAPEGIAALEAVHPDVDIYTPVVDRELSAKKYILPGLGDFGDRLYGTE